MSTLVVGLYYILLILYYIFMQTFKSPQLPIIYMVCIFLQDSDQYCKFFRQLDNRTCPRGHETAPIAWERFTRLTIEAEVGKNERDNVRARETKALEWERIVKCKVEKSRLSLWITKHKLYKYKVALFMSWLVIGLYFFFFPLYLGAMDICNCACHDFIFYHVSNV